MKPNKLKEADWMNPQAWTAFGLISPTICFGGLALTLAFGIDLEICLLGISIAIAALSMYQLPPDTPKIKQAILLPLSAVIIFAYSTQTSNTMADAHESMLNTKNEVSFLPFTGFVTSAYAAPLLPSMDHLPSGKISVTYWKGGNAYTDEVDPDLFDAIGVLYEDRNNSEIQQKQSPFRVFKG